MQGTDKLSAVDVNDLGDAVLGALKNPTAWTGETVNVISSATMTVGDYIASLAKATGKPMKLNYIPPHVFAKFGFPGAEEIANMCAYYSECGFLGPRPSSDPRSGAKAAGHALTTFDNYLAANPYKLPA